MSGVRHFLSQSGVKISAEQAKQYVKVATPTMGGQATTLSVPGALQGAMQSPSAARANGYLKRWTRDIGSRVAKDAAGAPRLLLAMGLFGRDTGLAIRRQVWTESHPDWYPLPPTEPPPAPPG